MIVSVDEFNYDMLADYGILKKRKKKAKEYLNTFMTFDIESSTLKDIDQAFMYIWQLQATEDITVIGRSWEEFFKFFENIKDRIKDVAYLVVYVHNLSYEFQFLKGVYDFEPDEVFCTDSRQILYCTMFDCIEFRCSYQLTNMSLDKLLKKYNVANLKLSGEEFNYSIVRYPWTVLTDRELEYCVNDVKGLRQAIVKMLESDNDNISTIPLTATGYVRRDVKDAMQGFNHETMRELQPTKEIYLLLREAFRGGNTMANRYYVNDIIDNVQSADEVSAYPYVMLTKRYPMTPFRKQNATASNLKKNLANEDVALLIKFTLYNVRLRDNLIGYPYISLDKCIERVNYINSNGRILKAEKLTLTCTDIDFRIILDMYKWDHIKVHKLYSSRYRMLPIMFRNVIMKYYRVKTELKGVAEGTDDYFFYMKNKEKLNAAYGMTVQDPCRDEYKFISNDYVVQEKDIEKMLAEHKRSAFLSYQWGVWVTAHARASLQEAINKAGFNYVYCDTDSIKYVGELDLSEINARREAEAKKYKAYATDRNGKVHYMGVFEDEGYSLPNRFSTMGAKKYVLEDSSKKLHITIAGVNKKKGADELGQIENFKEGFIFSKAGGTESIFNDNVDSYYFTLDGHKLHLTDNLVIKDSTYTLGETQEFKDILAGISQIKFSTYDIPGLYTLKK